MVINPKLITPSSQQKVSSGQQAVIIKNETSKQEKDQIHNDFGRDRQSDSDDEFGDMNDRDTGFHREFEKYEDQNNPFKASPTKTMSPEDIFDQQPATPGFNQMADVFEQNLRNSRGQTVNASQQNQEGSLALVMSKSVS